MSRLLGAFIRVFVLEVKVKSAPSCMAAGSGQPSLAGCAWAGAPPKTQLDQALAESRGMVSEFLRFFAGFDDQFHRSINWQT
jgi:hypothetical protein